MDLELPTGFETAEHAHQAGADAILSQDVAGECLFVELTGIEILHRASASLGRSQGSFLDPLGDLLHVVAKVLEEDLVGPVAETVKSVFDMRVQREPRGEAA